MSNPEFYDAITNNQMDLVQQAITSGTININEYNSEGITPLLCAIRAGNLEIVNVLVTAGANINESNQNNNYNPISYALVCNQNAIFMRLLELGADLNRQNSMGDYALHTLVDAGLFEQCELLLKEGCAVNLANHFGHTPLMFAAFKGDVLLVELLIYYGANPFLTDSKGVSALNFAQYTQCRPVVTFLESFLQHINCLVYGGYTSLAFAAFKADLTYIQQLYNHGGDISFVHPTSNLGVLALSVKSQNLDCVKLVVRLGHCAYDIHPQHYIAIKTAIYLNNDAVFDYIIKNIGVDTASKDFMQLLDETLSANRRDRLLKLISIIPNNHDGLLIKLQIFWLFVENGLLDLCKEVFDPSIHANSEYRDTDGNNFLHIAVINEHIEVVKFLLPYIQVNTLNYKWLSAVDLAVQSENTDMLRILKESGADLDNPFNPEKNSSLMKAFRNERYKAAQCLIELGANISHANCDGETALHIFAKQSRFMIIDPRLFITLFKERGFNFDLADCNGNTPLMLAVEQNSLNFVFELLNVGANTFLRNNAQQDIYDIACAAGHNMMKELVKPEQQLVRPKKQFQFFTPVDHAPSINPIEEDWYSNPISVCK